MEKQIYYRPNCSNGEIISERDYKRFCFLFGTEHSYNQFETLEVFHDSGSSIHSINNIILTIQNDSRLYAEDQKIRERIAKKKGKLTPSRRSYVGNPCVETGLVYELAEKAIKEINKCSDSDEAIKNIPYRELLRMYNIPYTGILEVIDKHEKKVELVTKPVHIYDLDFYYKGQQECQSTFQENAIIIKNYPFGLNDQKEIYKKFPYLAKLYYSTVIGEPNLQIYVYDCMDRGWAVQNIVHELVTRGSIQLM